MQVFLANFARTPRWGFTRSVHFIWSSAGRTSRALLLATGVLVLFTWAIDTRARSCSKLAQITTGADSTAFDRILANFATQTFVGCIFGSSVFSLNTFLARSASSSRNATRTSCTAVDRILANFATQTFVGAIFGSTVLANAAVLAVRVAGAIFILTRITLGTKCSPRYIYPTTWAKFAHCFSGQRLKFARLARMALCLIESSFHEFTRPAQSAVLGTCSTECVAATRCTFTPSI